MPNGTQIRMYIVALPFYAKVAFSKKYSRSIVFIVTFHKTNRVVPRSQPISRKGKDVE